MSDDTPTQWLSRPAGENDELVEERKKSRVLLFVLLGVGAALLVAVAVLVTVLILQPRPGTVPQADPAPPADAVPTPSATPTASETPTPTAAPPAEPVETQAPPPPPPPDTSPGFAAFSAPAVACPAPVGSGEDPGAPAIIAFSYTAKNAQSVWFIFGNEDAADQGIFEMPVQGDQSDVYDNDDPIYFPCNAASSTMTLTVVGTNGQHVNKTFTIVNNGHRD